MKRPIIFVQMTLLMLLPALVVANAGTFITIDPPGATSTVATGVTPAGAITGYYRDASGVGYGFLRAPNGTFTTIDVPGSIFTSADGINPAGAITGYYYDASFVAHGFLWTP